jgi:glyoxylase-like metal-dependent hydrolase (beta-lactamase superfamily II)
MHKDDSGMVERGDMLWNRKSGGQVLNRILIRVMLFVSGMSKFDRFKPDIYIEDGQDLSGYGFDAKALHIPGHSKGSIGILTSGGDLFCGDLLVNNKKPAKTSLIDDAAEANASVEKLKSLEINTVYPGHGRSFPMEQFIKNNQF